MAYTPSLSDVQDLLPQGSGSYTPSLADVHDLLPQQASSQAQSQSAIQKYADYLNQSPYIQGIVGARDAVTNTISGGLNLIPQGINAIAGTNIPTIPKLQDGSGTGYNVGQAIGNVGAFVGGGEALDAARAAAEGPSLVGKIASSLGGEFDSSAANFFSNTARRALGASAYGLATSDDDKLQNAGKQAGISTAFDVLGGGAAKIADTLGPTQYLQSAIQKLSGGQNLENNAKSIAAQLVNAANTIKGKAKDAYNTVFDTAGDSQLYSPVDPAVFGRQFANPGQYLNYGDDLTDAMSGNALSQHQQFLQNPTLQNAHNLQSALGSDIGNLSDISKKQGLNKDQANQLSTLSDARSSLLTDISDHLQNNFPELAPAYQQAKDFYKNDYVPFLNNPKIYQVASELKTNPGNIAGIFKNPEPQTLNMVNNLGDDFKNQILYSILGRNSATKSPDAFIGAVNKLKSGEGGLSSYITPDVEHMVDQVSKRIRNRNVAQDISSGLTGSTIGGALLGAPGYGLGALAAHPQVASKVFSILNLLPTDKLASGIQKSYPAIRNAILANSLNSNGAQQ